MPGDPPPHRGGQWAPFGAFCYVITDLPPSLPLPPPVPPLPAPPSHAPTRGQRAPTNQVTAGKRVFVLQCRSVWTTPGGLGKQTTAQGRGPPSGSRWTVLTDGARISTSAARGSGITLKLTHTAYIEARIHPVLRFDHYGHSLAQYEVGSGWPRAQSALLCSVLR
jgi:hypothetical protein